MSRFPLLVVSVITFVLAACGSPPATQSDADSDSAAPQAEIKMVDSVKKKTVPGFGGIIAESYEDSEEWWPPYKEPKPGAIRARSASTGTR